ncbi:threonylcarbamoyl-AMP synthase [Weissella diestrammenae]|uniref:Threonylcarbamoyl-AMP synthase n=1 Tax=Weissella diestrammenae TaxID=1162633 RepID=A0A7G9T6V9_9LACO|nr:L-threonylcarbamoyladenylate synthase [Weissella diestrammenae]MCM0582573.1 threonylcarbamoyl-AMP synthase [Weissella diestrammenae]QNN75834.1 threonylcarbamoyl-AMP synthase [Weissella diestrammenae]
MITKIWQSTEIPAAAKALQQGKLVAFPTETVYGLGADAFNENAVSKVYAAKGRPSDNPLIVHVATPEQVQQYAVVDQRAQKLMTAFWPGPLTIILPVKPNVLSPVVTGGMTTVASRMPDNQATLNLITETGSPLVGPSANTSGKPSPTTAQHVYHDLHGKIAGILDDGSTRIGVESTVIDLSVAQPVILRPGKITAEQIATVIDTVVDTSEQHVAADEAPKAPGMKYRHYAPDKAVYIVDYQDWTAAVIWAQGQLEPVGLMMPDQLIEIHQLAGMDFVWSLGDNGDSAAAKLFAGLRHFDDQKDIQTILVASMPDTPENAAYNNRLGKAAGGHHFTVEEFS